MAPWLSNVQLVLFRDLAQKEQQRHLDQVRRYFLGFYDTLSWFVGDSVPEAEIAAVFDEFNQTEE